MKAINEPMNIGTIRPMEPIHWSLSINLHNLAKWRNLRNTIVASRQMKIRDLCAGSTESRVHDEQHSTESEIVSQTYRDLYTLRHNYLASLGRPTNPRCWNKHNLKILIDAKISGLISIVLTPESWESHQTVKRAKWMILLLNVFPSSHFLSDS